MNLRWMAAGIGLLVPPECLPHRSGSPTPLWLGARRPQDLQTCLSSAAVKERTIYLAAGPPSGFVAGIVSEGRGRPRRYRWRRKTGWNKTAVHSRVPRREAYSEATTMANDGGGRRKHRHPSRPQQSAAVVLELQPRAADTNALAVYGELHRLLGTTRSRQLLGVEAVATLTSLNFLVLHHRSGGPSLYDEAGEGDGDGSGARLALGHRCWDICGIGQWVSFMPTCSPIRGKLFFVVHIHSSSSYLERA